MDNQIIVFLLFNVFVLAMLAIDLGVFHRKSHAVKFKEALAWCGVWVSLALLFNLGIYFWKGPQKALEFLTGYLIEYSLSIDNIFVFLLLFTYFGVASQYQHKILFWGIIGALVMRATFIVAGVTLIQKFHWIIYVFGAVLIISGIKMALEKDKEIHPENNFLLKLMRKFIPIATDYEEGKFFVKTAGKYKATPLFVVLFVVETTDVVFAADSIPAILAITIDPFIVYTSNVFAILGLRSLFFALSGIMELFHYLHYGLSAILIFVGIKMLIGDFYKIPIGYALGVIFIILATSVITSILNPKDPVSDIQ